jgi:prephenate dehydrogenase
MKPARECRHIAILGVGLMGASIAAALKRSFPDTVIVGSSISPNDGRIALEKGYIDRFTQNNKEAVVGAERVIVASPPSTIISVLKEISEFVPGIPVTDISSVKSPIYQGFKEELRSLFPDYTSSHPMAGREESGAQGARANLFDGRTTFLVPFSETLPSQSRDWETFWIALGCRTTFSVDPAEHDQILSLVSHLPHIVSYAVLELLNKAEERNNLPHFNWEEQKGGALTDMTRISHSHPGLWGEILAANNKSLIQDLSQLIEILISWKKQLASGAIEEIREKIESVQHQHQSQKKRAKKEKKDSDAH